MTVYLLLKIVDQNNYTEPKYYESAKEHVEICGVYVSSVVAEKRRDELILENAFDDNKGYEEYRVEEHKIIV